MNLKTTIILAVLVIAGGVAAWFTAPSQTPERETSPTVEVLEQQLTPTKLTRIDIHSGERQVLLERKGDEWALPGQWPVRQPEVAGLVRLLTSLRTRFAPLPLADPPELKKFGLDGQPLLVKVEAGGHSYALAFGEGSEEANRFSRPTYVRLDKNTEVVRLAPGLISELDRPQGYYMQRRLFPTQRIAKEGDSGEKVAQVAAKGISAKGPGESYTLVRKDKDWELTEPVRDRPDPDALQKILTAIPDLWAEKFVDRKKKTLDDFGLKDPVDVLQVTRPSGQTVKLLIGKLSDVKKREVEEPAPPFGPPRPPMKKTIVDEYRFAKIADNEQIFEIKADKLKDIVVAANTLRDPRLARFRTDDARRLEIEQGKADIVLAKDKEQWRLKKPKEVDAETSKVTELLDKLSGLEAKDKDVIDKGDPKQYGLDKPAVIKVSVEETKGKGDAKTTETRQFEFRLGKHDTATKKVYVQVAGWPRINAVDDAILKLSQRPALAYRGRKVLDFSTFDLAKIEVHRPGEDFTLEQVKNNWRLAAPVQAGVDAAKADQLAGDLARLEAVEFVTGEAKAEDLDKLYGLAKPALSVKIVPADAKKAQTLLIGKERDGKGEFYARLEADPAVFTIKKDVREAVARESLAYRPLKLWDVPASDIAEVRIRKGEPEYDLKRDGINWKIAGPFEAPALPGKADALAEQLANLKCERYVAHTAKDLGAYGLDKPYVRVALVPKKDDDKKKDEAKAKKEVAKERVLLIGKPVSKDGKDTKERYARLGDGEAVFVLNDKTVAALDLSALDLLDPTLARTDVRDIQKVKKTGGGAWTLQQEKEQWRVVDTPAPPFPADKEQTALLLETLANLRAKSFAAYGPKVDLAQYGLDKDKAAVTIAVTLKPGDEKDKKPAERVLVLGKEVKDAAGERYARLDSGPGVAILDAATVKRLTQTYLAFVDHQLLKLDAAKVTVVQRQVGGAMFELRKDKESWRIVKPVEMPADQPTVLNLVEDLAGLRVERVAAYPATDLKGQGLEPPAALITVQLPDADGKNIVSHTLRIGKPAEGDAKKPSGDRYVRADGSAVGVLSARLVKELLADPVHFRDRNLARFDTADRVVLERGPRKAVFSRTDDVWKMIDPVAVDAESAQLEALIKNLSRLRAAEVVPNRPADLKLYGFDRPRARWQLSAAGKDVLVLLVGGDEKAEAGAKPRAYAKLAGSDLVFLLTPELTARALAEYRTRKIWTSLDAAQVEKLTFKSEQNTFTLEKADNKWQIAGKPGLTLKQDAVRDLLDALAKLQVDHYVLDKGADLKLFGLQPPVLTLEAQLPTDKRTLHIGRPEGDTRRHYAALPGSDAVFVISEKDAQAVVRMSPQSLVERPTPAKK